MTTIDPPDGAETNVIADPTPPTRAKTEVIVERNPALVGAETEMELPEPQVIVKLNPPQEGDEAEIEHPETQEIELDAPLVGDESDALVDLASADRSTIPVFQLSNIIENPELGNVTIWEVSRLLNALASWPSQTQ